MIIVARTEEDDNLFCETPFGITYSNMQRILTTEKPVTNYADYFHKLLLISINFFDLSYDRTKFL